ncbi:hypothetical protein CP97_06655 [Aurantiacibacter atlanticus]|uniref:Uncharacterized protein n=2 Tax=Aurantiacibacter atlanticus TaxID=1648404 RepID=A0A0H4W167_9SPHN|nr:hypothetical protein CP97_06655 [Aurantiacibacter atlanticus]
MRAGLRVFILPSCNWKENIMAEQLTREQIARAADIHAAPPAVVRNDPVDRTFGLPKKLYMATVGLYLGFIAVLCWGFGNPVMVIPIAICVLIIVAGFGLPTMWTRMKPFTSSKPATWAHFSQRGIATASGHTRSRDASVQVLILPVLILAWGLAFVTIAALV